MSNIFENPQASIVKTVASFLLTISAAIGSFTAIVILTVMFVGNRIVSIQSNDVTILLYFVLVSLAVSLFILALSCFVLSLLSKVSTDGFN
jgi:hypothetical protein